MGYGSLLLYFKILVIVTVSPARADLIKLCRDIKNYLTGQPAPFVATYHSQDFKPSVFWYGAEVGGRPHRDRYSSWAAEEANVVAEQLRRGGEIPTILDGLATQRQNLERDLSVEQPTRDWIYFGQIRENFIAYDLPVLKPNLSTAEKEINERARRALVPDAVLKEGNEDKSRFEEHQKMNPDARGIDYRYIDFVYQDLQRQFPSTFPPLADRPKFDFRNNYYHATDGQTYLAVTSIKFDSNQTKKNERFKDAQVLIFPDPQVAQKIMRDVEKRLTKLKENRTLSEDEALVEFANCMYGFYVSHYWVRGTSAIGRSFFAGYFLDRFGRKLPPLPDGIDLRADTALTQKEFVQEVLVALKRK